MGIVKPPARSAFEHALSALNPEQRARALRLRTVLNLRDDDVLWMYCGILKNQERVFEETLARCISTVQQTVEATRTASPPLARARVPAPRSGARRPALHLASLVSLAAAWSTLVGSAVFAFSTHQKHGHVPWLHATEASGGALKYVLLAVLDAPVGGFFALVGLLILGPVVAALYFAWRRGRLAGR